MVVGYLSPMAALLRDFGGKAEPPSNWCAVLETGLGRPIHTALARDHQTVFILRVRAVARGLSLPSIRPTCEKLV
jgi:hypothetical protein